MAAELFDQHRDFHGPEPETAAPLGHLHSEPSLVDHRPPQGAVEGGVGRGVRTDARRRCEVVEHVAGTGTQRELIFGEVEVHGGPSLAGTITTSSI